MSNNPSPTVSPTKESVVPKEPSNFSLVQSELIQDLADSDSDSCSEVHKSFLRGVDGKTKEKEKETNQSWIRLLNPKEKEINLSSSNLKRKREESESLERKILEPRNSITPSSADGRFKQQVYFSSPDLGSQIRNSLGAYQLSWRPYLPVKQKIPHI
jgi:hypothetical protein